MCVCIKGEENLVPALSSLGVWDDITKARNLMSYHAESLLLNHNNNAAELYNSILTKFIGGKRVNFSLKGSYQLRCNAAVMAYNAGSNRLSLFNKHVTNKSPGKYTKMLIKKYQKTANARKIRRQLFSAIPKNKSKISYVGPDENYGNISNSLTHLTIEEKEKLKNNFLKELQLDKNEIRDLEKRTVRQNQCEEWHLERKKRFVLIILIYKTIFVFVVA